MVQLFKKTAQKSVLETLQEQSSQAIGVIHTLINSLKDTNQRIDEEKAANVQRLKAIENEQNTLDKLRNENSKIVSNFEGLLGKEAI